MTEQVALAEVQQALWTALMLSTPALGAALVVGTAVSLFQAVTQIQEATLVFVPKILAVFAALGIAGGWMLEISVRYARICFESLAAWR